MLKITVFSGEDFVSSRKAYTEYLGQLREKDFELIVISGKDLTKESLTGVLGSPSLFGKKKALSIENFLSLPKSQEKESLIKFLLTFLEGEVVFWEVKEISKTEKEIFPSASVIKNFKLPEVLFSFLEQISPGRPEENLKSFQSAILQTDANFLFLMFVRQVRQLIMAKSSRWLETQSPWLRVKIQKQSQKFSLEELKSIYQKLLQIDYQQKTSSSPLDLKSSLEVLIAEI